MTDRSRLPNRRPNSTTSLEFDGTAFSVTIGYSPDGRPAEVFCHGPKVGSAIMLMLDDAAVGLSLLLQHGVDPVDLAGSMGRVGAGEPASIIGALVDLLAAEASA